LSSEKTGGALDKFQLQACAKEKRESPKAIPCFLNQSNVCKAFCLMGHFPDGFSKKE